MGAPQILGKKLAAFAKKPKGDKDAKNPFAKGKKPGDDDEEKDPEGDEHEDGDESGVHSKKKYDLKKAEEDAADHNDDEIEEHMSGYDPEIDGNPPESVDEDIWNKAKAAVQPKWNSYDQPYAVVSYVYKQMGGSFKSKKG